jgi:dTDP-glucose 4,6-dehydratase
VVFIGSHVVRLFVKKYPQYQIFNLDALTYAGNLENIVDIEKEPNYTFIKEISLTLLSMLCLLNINLMEFCIWLRSRMIVPLLILYLCENKCYWDNEFVKCRENHMERNYEGKRFYHISTDEVYGSLGAKACLLKLRLMILIRLILHPKRVQITL